MTSFSPPGEFVAAFQERANATGSMRFDTFVDLALYHPRLGYYARPEQRVGYGPGTDFYTASTSGPVFGELVAAAAVQLLDGRPPGDYSFVEIGAETPLGVLGGVTHPFREARTLRLGQALELEGRCIVFSNELFDAQPFRRLRFQEGCWRELGVACRDGTLHETVLPLAPLPDWVKLPSLASEGYTIDAPVAAVQLADTIARSSWQGLFLAFDYGKSWQELVEAAPAGTARAYFRHTQSNDLLARPGEQDLTCHVCWDWLEDVLRGRGFGTTGVEAQESFFIRRAGSYLSTAIAADAARFTPRKQTLMQLLHGSHLGRKFQVLHALR